MLNQAEIDAMDAAINRFAVRLDEAKKAAGWGITDWLFDAFYFGGSPREDVRNAVLGGETLLNALRQKRGEVIRLHDVDEHEQALSIIEIANRAAKWDRAASLEQYRNATDIATQTGKAIGDKLTPENLEQALKYIKYAVYGIVALLVAIVGLYATQLLSIIVPRKTS